MPYKDPEQQKEARNRYELTRRKGKRFTTWTLIFYPESAPSDWQIKLSELHLPVWISPLHDRDQWTDHDQQLNPDHVSGSFKKPHYHLIAQYPHAESVDVFIDDFSFLNGSSVVKNVKALNSMVRYLIHKDDADKAQYCKDDILCFGGADLDPLYQLGNFERHQALKQMRAFIIDNCIVDFYKFYEYCDACNREWAYLLDDNSLYVIKEFIYSVRKALEHNIDKKMAESRIKGDISDV